MHSLGREVFLTRFDWWRTVGSLLHRGFLNCYSLIIRVSQVGRVRSFVLSCSRQVRLIFDVLNCLLPAIPDGTIQSCRINGRVSEYIDYTKPGENDYLDGICYLVTLFSSIRAYYQI